MDPDGEFYRKNNKKQKNLVNNNLILGKFLPAFWLRCPFSYDNGVNQFFLDYGRYFLPYFGIFLYIIYFITKIN